jgi:hypothetical protein
MDNENPLPTGITVNTIRESVAYANAANIPFLVDGVRQLVNRADGGDLSPDECRDAAEGRHPLSRGSM